jgi:ABC-type transporter Mla maintaining outer membrane lipid asymmetry ATPase subunit MlaF
MENVAVGSMQDPAAEVLKDVNWQVASGNFWALAGLQGTGKSDFLMMTAGLMGPMRGHYWLFGEEMPIYDEHRLSFRLRLGLVFENGQLLNHLSVRENLGLPLRYHHNLTKAEADPVVQQMLDLMELGPWADSTPGALARNWLKRAGLARALILKPEILLLDNPLAGLDLLHASWWLDLLKQLTKPANFVREQPLTLVATTADLRPWLDVASCFAILKHQLMTVIGNRAQLQTAANDLLSEVLPAKVPLLT